MAEVLGRTLSIKAPVEARSTNCSIKGTHRNSFCLMRLQFHLRTALGIPLHGCQAPHNQRQSEQQMLGAKFLPPWPLRLQTCTHRTANRARSARISPEIPGQNRIRNLRVVVERLLGGLTPELVPVSVIDSGVYELQTLTFEEVSRADWKTNCCPEMKIDLFV